MMSSLATRLARSAVTVSSTSWALSSASRIRLTSAIIVRASSSRKRERERRAGVDAPFRPDPSALAVDDAPHVGEADPVAFEIVRAVKPLEHAEQLVRVRHVEPDAVVAHEHDR